MIIIGHPAIAFSPFTEVTSIDDIVRTEVDSIVWFDSRHIDEQMGFDIANHCQKYHINYAVMIYSLKSALIFSQLNAKYLIIATSIKTQAKQLQNIIEYYMLDCKLLYIIKRQSQLSSVAKLGIDGAIFKQVLDRI